MRSVAADSRRSAGRRSVCSGPQGGLRGDVQHGWVVELVERVHWAGAARTGWGKTVGKTGVDFVGPGACGGSARTVEGKRRRAPTLARRAASGMIACG
jgi:hypothetical protein